MTKAQKYAIKVLIIYMFLLLLASIFFGFIIGGIYRIVALSVVISSLLTVIGTFYIALRVDKINDKK